MPELPEVEIVKQSLKKKIKFKKIKKVTIRNRNLRFKLQKNFGKFLKNRFVKEISRISKYLILELDNQKYCIIHLGMSGTIHLISKKKQNKFTNLSFYQSRTLPEKQLSKTKRACFDSISFAQERIRVIFKDFLKNPFSSVRGFGASEGTK